MITEGDGEGETCREKPNFETLKYFGIMKQEGKSAIRKKGERETRSWSMEKFQRKEKERRKRGRRREKERG